MGKFIKEFKEFAMRGNVMDMAVGIIVGGAFGQIVNSFVNDVIMPPIGMLIGGVDFSDLVITLRKATLEHPDPVVMKIGVFINTIINFLIIAFAIFMMIKLLNSMKRKQEATVAATPPAPSKEEVLLTEIRDLLKENNSTHKESHTKK